MSEKLRKIELELHKLSEMISEFQSEQDKQINNQIDYGAIENYGKTKPIKRHIIEKMDNELRYKYLVLLMAGVELANSQELKTKQLYFISRLYYSAEKANGILETLTQVAKTLEQSDMVQWKEQFSEDEKDVLLTDLLLMCSLNGNVEEKQREFFGELCALFNMSKEKISAIIAMCKAILLQEDDEIMNLIAKMDANLFKCYMKEYVKEPILHGLDSIKECKDSVVILANTDIGKTEKNLDFDVYEKQKIIFKNCRFTDTKPVIALKTECVFERCVFQDYDYELDESDSSWLWMAYFEHASLRCPEHLSYIPHWKGRYRFTYESEHIDFAYFYLKKALFISCKFRDIIISAEDWGNRSTTFSFMRAEDSRIESCSFERCRLKIKAELVDSVSLDMASILNVYNSQVLFCNFIECIYEHMPSRWTTMFGSILWAVNGEVKQNYFAKCKFGGNENIKDRMSNYIICLDKAKEQGSIFEQCECRQIAYQKPETSYAIGRRIPGDSWKNDEWEGVSTTVMK